MYARIWDANFGPSLFAADLEGCDQQEDTVEYEPTPQPGIYRPPSHNNFENSGGIPAEPQLIGKTPSENKCHEAMPETSRNPENSQVIPSQNSPETPENNPEIDAQDAEETANTRSEKYTLLLNPNPNYPDSYRY